MAVDDAGIIGGTCTTFVDPWSDGRGTGLTGRFLPNDSKFGTLNVFKYSSDDSCFGFSGYSGYKYPELDPENKYPGSGLEYTGPRIEYPVFECPGPEYSGIDGLGFVCCTCPTCFQVDIRACSTPCAPSSPSIRKYVIPTQHLNHQSLTDLALALLPTGLTVPPTDSNWLLTMLGSALAPAPRSSTSTHGQARAVLSSAASEPAAHFPMGPNIRVLGSVGRLYSKMRHFMPH